MKKTINMVLSLVAVAAASFGGYKAHCAYVAANMSEDELLMMENVEALSQTEPANGCDQKGWTGTCQNRGGAGNYICSTTNGTSHCTIHCGTPHKH